MEEVEQTWRDLLGRIISDPHERARIADTTGVNPITLTRWVTNKSNPRQDNLRPLVDAVAYYRQQLTELIAVEFPGFFSVNPMLEDSLQTIPSTFYIHVLNAYSTSPRQLRASSVCLLIMQQILSHLDPHQKGLVIIVAQCVAPEPGKNVRSLRKTLVRGTEPWESYLNNRTLFFGAESQAGHVLATKHPIIVQNQQEKQRAFPQQYLHLEESRAVYPILLADRTAGSLCISSTQANYFTQMHLDLIQCYTDLMALAFSCDEYYDLEMIELGIMPPPDRQLPHFTQFQDRITQQMLRAELLNKPITRPEAELVEWRALETTLLILMLSAGK